MNIREESKEDNLNYEAFQSRLQWLANKFKDIERSSCEIESSAPKQAKLTAELEGLIGHFQK